MGTLLPADSGEGMEVVGSPTEEYHLQTSRKADPHGMDGQHDVAVLGLDV